MSTVPRTAEELMVKANDVYAASEDCFIFASRLYGIPRSLFLTRLLERVGFRLVWVVKAGGTPPTWMLEVGDVFLFLPPVYEEERAHVALYLRGDLLISKWGLYEGIIVDTYEVHAETYAPGCTAILRQVPTPPA
jgi:hypothetical protein